MKKKILFLTTFILAIVTILYSVGVKGVNAETCTTYTNYYPLLGATDKSIYNTQFETEDPWEYNTKTEFYSGLPEGAVIVGKGQVEILETGEDSFDEITLETFYKVWKNTAESTYSEDGGITTYTRGASWYDENDQEQSQESTFPNTFAKFKAQVPENFGNPEIMLNMEEDTIQLDITRTWSSEELENIESGVVYSPAMFYIQYKICEEPEEPKKVSLTINFGTNNNCSEGTDIRKSETTEYEEGESVRYTIPEISGYDFSNVGTFSPTTFNPAISTNSNNLSFDVPGKNTSICLVYIKNPQTGAGWIYFAWIIGIAALAYSGWYFMKYYKNTNNEI